MIVNPNDSFLGPVSLPKSNLISSLIFIDEAYCINNFSIFFFINFRNLSEFENKSGDISILRGLSYISSNVKDKLEIIHLIRSIRSWLFYRSTRKIVHLTFFDIIEIEVAHIPEKCTFN